VQQSAGHTGPRPAALWCGGGPLFVATFLAEGARRPGYDPRRHPVSSLALGPGGWVQVANFTITGVLYLALAAGLARTPDPAADTRAGPVLIGAAAGGLLGAGAFTTDPVSGYPPGTPDTPAATALVVPCMTWSPRRRSSGCPQPPSVTRERFSAMATAAGPPTRLGPRWSCSPASGWPARHSVRRRRW
jgi:Protein of unknown function (DUF998)